MVAFVLSLFVLMQGVQAPGGTVSGQVRLANGSPATGVRVSVVPTGTDAAGNGDVVVRSVRTDIEGRYQIEDVPAGRYYVASGFLDRPTYYPGVTALAEARPVTVSGGSVVQDVNFSVSSVSVTSAFSAALDGIPTSQSVGRLIVENGGALPSSSLSRIEALGKAANFPEVLQSMRAGILADGWFILRLPAGEYQISVAGLPRGYFVRSIVSGSTDVHQNPMKVDGITSPPEILVTLAASTSLQGRVVRGKVTNLPSSFGVLWRGRPLVRLIWADQQQEILETPLNLDGTFSFPSVPSGVYTQAVVGVDTGFGIVRWPTLSVGDEDLQNVVIELPKRVEVVGYVTVVDNLGRELLAAPVPKIGLRFETSRGGGGGGLRFLFPPGKYSFTVDRLPANYVVQSMTAGSTNLMTTPLEIDDSQITVELDIKLELKLR